MSRILDAMHVFHAALQAYGKDHTPDTLTAVLKAHDACIAAHISLWAETLHEEVKLRQAAQAALGAFAEGKLEIKATE